eukprot:5693801-Amphidinium_carterae.1
MRSHCDEAFQREDFKICGCMVEHNLARLERWLGLHKPKLMRHTPLSVRLAPLMQIPALSDTFAGVQ